ncbi:glycerate kinase, partial [Staphylococcus aureus]
MLSALGVNFTDVNGDLLQMNGAIFAHFAQIDITNLDSRFNEVSYKVASDDYNPLLGENGATYIYG